MVEVHQFKKYNAAIRAKKSLMEEGKRTRLIRNPRDMPYPYVVLDLGKKKR